MGSIHSLQSFGAADGPGVRYVVFMQGCPLRCHCCHNPDTWDGVGGKEMSAEAVFSEVKKYKEYFGKEGGLTISGGEPLLQPNFCMELFILCKQAGINTCLDTSGCLINDSIKELLKYTDTVLLDIKYTDDEAYLKYVGCSLSAPLNFLALLNEMNIRTWLREVIIPGKNDKVESLNKLKKIAAENSNVEKTELLPFKKLCIAKYAALKIPFPFLNIPEPSPEAMAKAKLSISSLQL